jgi:shikimate kinase
MRHLDGRNIFLLGFMATGKSRVGAELAELLQWDAIDTDEMIEKSTGKSISEIFTFYGEAGFREIEKKIVTEVCEKKNCVISLGGGAVLDPENWRAITNSGITICLTASEDVLFERISQKSNRPLMAAESHEEMRTRMNRLLQKRLPYYSRADVTFQSKEEVTAEELALQIYHYLLNDHAKDNR